jgi:two-component system, chemotaxis family, protein-glutamate methylesterase/glutaminase
MPDVIPPFQPNRFKVVAIGSSTGGPTLVQQIIAGLPADMPVPILIAQHLPPKFTHEMALAMDRQSPLTVVEAEDGQPVFPGTVYLGPGRMHTRVVKGLSKRPVIKVSDQPAELLYKPSVDELFDACAQVYGKHTLGIVMTGIGQDGTIGAGKIVQAGGVILTQNKATCAVYGMPRSCDDANLSSARLSPEQLRQAIHQLSPSFQQAPQRDLPSRSA